MTTHIKKTVGEPASREKNDTYKMDLIVFDPIRERQILPNYKLLAEKHGLTKNQADLLMTYIMHLPESYLYHIDMDYVDFIRDIHTLGGEARFINDFFGWMPVTYVTYKQKLSQKYLNVLKKHGLLEARVYVEWKINGV